MNHFRLGPAIVTWILCFLPSMALAQARPNLEARRHFDRGLALAKDKAYAEAIVEFNRAYEISPHFAVLFNLGQAYIAVDQPVYAAEALRRYLNEGGKKIPKARRKQVEADIAQQSRRIATLVVRCALDGALVQIDGVDVGKTPLPNAIWSKAGPHVISASIPGYRRWEERVDLVGSFQKTVEIRLEPTSAALAPPVAAGAPAAPPLATRAATPATSAPSLPAATPPAPLASAQRAQMAPASEPTPPATPGQAGQGAAAAPTSAVTPSQATSPASGSVASSPEPGSTRTRKIAAYLVGGAGIASLAVGGVFGFRAISKRHDSDAECPGNRCSEQGVRLNDEAKTAAWVSDFTIGAGLVGVAVATYLLLRSPAPEVATPGATASAIGVSPEVGAGKAGLSLRGSW